MKLLVLSLICFVYGHTQQNPTDSINQYNSLNQKVGKWIGFWKETNQIAFEEFYINGQRNGVCVYYYPSGVIREKSEYLNDQLNGNSEIYSITGTLRETAQIKNGKKEGLTRYFNYKRQLVEEQYYQNNLSNGVHRTYYESGRIQTEGNFVNGYEDGIRKTFKDNDNKEVVLETVFENGQRIEHRVYKKSKLIRIEKDF